MKILCLLSGLPHAHDYGLDYLLDGFREVLGPANVYELPEKPCLHLPPGAPRDECQIDSDAWWPLRSDGVAAEDFAMSCDAVFLMVPKDDQDGLRAASRFCIDHVPASTPVVAIDMSDHLEDYRELFTGVACRPLAAYFKRELPLGADWAIPCPLTYPASRPPDPLPAKVARVFYHATHHGDGPAGEPRKRIVADLMERIPATRRDLGLYPGQTNRPTPEEYHARMATALVGVSFNGAPNWDNNRFWESFAYGLCQVAERPRIQIPHPPEHLRHCWFVDRPEEVAPAVSVLLQQPAWALAIADAGRTHFLKYHCSRARAEWVMENVRRLG